MPIKLKMRPSFKVKMGEIPLQVINLFVYNIGFS